MSIRSVWMQSFDRAKAYYLREGNLKIHINYVDSTGLKLGKWLSLQRLKYNNGSLGEEKISLLESIGIVWDKYDLQWNTQYNLLRDYLTDKDNSLYPLSRLPRLGGYDIYHWCTTQISQYKKGRLTSDRKNLLEQLGFVWNMKEQNWEEMFQITKQYYEDFCLSEGNTHLIVDSKEEHKKIKIWIKHQRADYKNKTNSLFTQERIDKLNSIGMVWNENDLQWLEKYEIAKEYYAKHGNLDVTIDINHILFTWIRTERKAYKAGTLSEERIDALNRIGMIWDASKKIVKSSFPEKIVFYYFSKVFPDIQTNNREILNGKELDIFIPSKNCAIEYDGSFYHGDSEEDDREKNKLCSERKILLIRIREKGLKDFEETDLLKCVNRGDYRTMEEVLKRLSCLLSIDFDSLDFNLERDAIKIFSLVEKPSDSFEEFYNECVLYYEEHGDLDVPINYIGTNGKDLHRWLLNARTGFHLKSKVYLNEENVGKLTKLGMVWSPPTNWDLHYPQAVDFYKKFGHLRIPRNYIVDGYNLGVWLKGIRSKYKSGKLTKEQIDALNSMGMIWSFFEK